MRKLVPERYLMQERVRRWKYVLGKKSCFIEMTYWPDISQ
jgi:hypothetical protein